MLCDMSLKVNLSRAHYRIMLLSQMEPFYSKGSIYQLTLYQLIILFHLLEWCSCSSSFQIIVATRKKFIVQPPFFQLLDVSIISRTYYTIKNKTKKMNVMQGDKFSNQRGKRNRPNVNLKFGNRNSMGE